MPTVAIGRPPSATPLTQTVWTQGESFFSGSIGQIETSVRLTGIPKELVFRRVYIALAICFTGTLVADPATDAVEHELTGDLKISDENVQTYRLGMYHNPTPSNMVLADETQNRTLGPWPPMTLYRPATLDNLVPKLPGVEHPDCRFFTMLTRKQDSVGGSFYHAVCKTLPLRVVVIGNNLEFKLKAVRPVSGSSYGHLIVACESSSHNF